MSPTSRDFAVELEGVLAAAAELGATAIELSSGALHRRAGDYPGPNHRMPICCEVMRHAMASGNRVVAEPPSGSGASLVIRYKIPKTT